jgi:hypothetical protein
MPFVCLLEWSGVRADQIGVLIELLDLDEKLRTGSATFGAGEDGGKLIVITVWEDGSALEQFLRSCLMQAVSRAQLPAPFVKRWNLEGQPEERVQIPVLEWKELFELQSRSSSQLN